jgi:hypothetical protein
MKIQEKFLQDKLFASNDVPKMAENESKMSKIQLLVKFYNRIMEY